MRRSIALLTAWLCAAVWAQEAGTYTPDPQDGTYTPDPGTLDPAGHTPAPVVTNAPLAPGETYFPTSPKCLPREYPIDVYFLLDGSKSIEKKDWVDMKVFVNKLITNGINIPGDRVGVVQFSSKDPVVHFTFQDGPMNIAEQILDIEQLKGGTHTDRGIQAVIDSWEMEATELVPRPKLFIIITDGVPHPDSKNPCLPGKPQVGELLAMDIETVIFGVSMNEEDVATLGCLVRSVEQNIVLIEDFSNFGQFRDPTDNGLLCVDPKIFTENPTPSPTKRTKRPSVSPTTAAPTTLMPTPSPTMTPAPTEEPTMVMVSDSPTNVPTVCIPRDYPIDVYFTVDGSTSIKKQDWIDLKEFMKKLIEEGMDITGDRMGIVQFSGKDPVVHFTFEDGRDKILSEILDMEQLKGGTKTDWGVQLTIDTWKSEPDLMDGRNRLMMLVTDGIPNPPEYNPCLDGGNQPEQLADLNIETVIIGISMEPEDIDTMACLVKSVTENVVMFNDFHDFSEWRDPTEDGILCVPDGTFTGAPSLAPTDPSSFNPTSNPSLAPSQGPTLEPEPTANPTIPAITMKPTDAPPCVQAGEEWEGDKINPHDLPGTPLLPAGVTIPEEGEHFLIPNGIPQFYIVELCSQTCATFGNECTGWFFHESPEHDGFHCFLMNEDCENLKPREAPEGWRSCDDLCPKECDTSGKFEGNPLRPNELPGLGIDNIDLPSGVTIEDGNFVMNDVEGKDAVQMCAETCDLFKPHCAAWWVQGEAADDSKDSPDGPGPHPPHPSHDSDERASVGTSVSHSDDGKLSIDISVTVSGRDEERRRLEMEASRNGPPGPEGHNKNGHPDMIFFRYHTDQSCQDMIDSGTNEHFDEDSNTDSKDASCKPLECRPHGRIRIQFTKEGGEEELNGITMWKNVRDEDMVILGDGHSDLPPHIGITVKGENCVQYINIHTSCSISLSKGQRWGALEIKSIRDGDGDEIDPCEPDDGKDKADFTCHLMQDCNDLEPAACCDETETCYRECYEALCPINTLRNVAVEEAANETLKKSVIGVSFLVVGLAVMIGYRAMMRRKNLQAAGELGIEEQMPILY